MSGNSYTPCREGDTEGWREGGAGADLAWVVGVGVGLTYLAFPPVPTVPFWLSHGEAGDLACAR